MYSENGVLVDFEEISKLVEEADVFVVGFSNFPERLLVDSRTNHKEIPLVQVVEPSTGARARLAWLMRRRPSLGQPEQFSFFAWPHSPGFMRETGVWDRIKRRVNAAQEPEVGVQCEMALRQLENLDMEAAMAILKGERCITLWPRDDDQED
ncbi:MAG TPA: hypothetical protein VJB57_17175 [Dehalococcoidia bacterium]|nr:hypothetical protein [Dehalococcoidia bacterium]